MAESYSGKSLHTSPQLNLWLPTALLLENAAPKVVSFSVPFTVAFGGSVSRKGSKTNERVPVIIPGHRRSSHGLCEFLKV